MKLIDRSTLRTKLGRATLVEALPEKYYREGHLPGAKHLPHDQVRQLAPAVLPHKDAEIVVYCANPECESSTDTADRLLALGYANVRHYPGGKDEWRSSGLPLERAGAPLIT
jgi:rhodanese-related sulfurtransferase